MSVNKHKIIVVDKEEELGLRVKEIFENLANYPCTVKWFSALVVDEVKGASCVIIDSRMIKDVKNLVEVLHALSVIRIVITTNELNHPVSSTAIMMGATVFYRHSPVTTLLPKIIDNFKSEKMLKPLTTSQNSPGNPGPGRFSGPITSAAKHFESDRGKFVMFYSPKGGVGKTSVLLNVAMNLAMKKLNVLVLDYSLFGSIRIKLKIDIHNPGLASIIPAMRNNQNHKNFDEIIKRNVYTYNFGENKFDVLTSDNPVSMANLGVEAVEYLNNIIYSLNYDLVLIDTSSDLSRINMALFEMCKDIVMVSTPDISSTWALIQHKELMHNLNLIGKCKIVLNMHHEIYGFLPNELETELQYPLLAVIPENQQVRVHENIGAFTSFNISDPFNIYYRQVAHNIVPIFSSDDIKIAQKKFSFNPFKK